MMKHLKTVVVCAQGKIVLKEKIAAGCKCSHEK